MRPAFLFLIVCVCSRLSFFLHQRTLGPNRLFSFSVHPASVVSLFLPGYSFLYFYYAIASRCVDWLPTRSLLDECSAHCLPIPTPPTHYPRSQNQSGAVDSMTDSICVLVFHRLFFSLCARIRGTESRRGIGRRERHTRIHTYKCAAVRPLNASKN